MVHDTITCKIEMIDVQLMAPASISEEDPEFHTDTDEQVAFHEDENDYSQQEAPSFVCRMPGFAGSFDINLPPQIQEAYLNFTTTDDLGTLPWLVTNRSSDLNSVFLVNVTHVYVDEIESRIAWTASSDFSPFVASASQAKQYGLGWRRWTTTTTTPQYQPLDERLLVVLRVSYLQWEPRLSASQLQGRIFGRGVDKVDLSLRSHIEACSMGQVSLQVKRGQGIVDGIVEIAISNKLVFGLHPERQLENEALRVAKKKLGSIEGFDHILIVLPNINNMLSYVPTAISIAKYLCSMVCTADTFRPWLMNGDTILDSIIVAEIQMNMRT